jgi:hypothetical protein
MLAADFLPVWFEKQEQQNLIEKSYPRYKQCLLYTNDTLFIMKPKEQQFQLIKVLLKIYGQLSGLQVNLQKKLMLVMSIDYQEVQALADIMECTTSMFSIKYMGMALSNKKLTKEHYRILIRAI